MNLESYLIPVRGLSTITQLTKQNLVFTSNSRRKHARVNSSNSMLLQVAKKNFMLSKPGISIGNHTVFLVQLGINLHE